MNSEQKIQKQITDYLFSLGCYQFKVISANKKGILDLTVCYKGRFISIEVKTPKTQKNISALQGYNIKQIKANGGIAFVAWTVEQVEKEFRKYELL